MDTKKHFKLYKDGKKWCVMAVATVASIIGLATTANADTATVTTSDVQTTQVADNSQTTTSQALVSEVASDVTAASASSSTDQTATSQAVDAQTSAAPAQTTTATDVTTTDQKNGWVNENNTWTYYTDGQVTSCRNYTYLPTINGEGHSWYLVDNGVVQSGVQKWAGTYYYFDPNTYLKVTNDYRQSQWGDWYLFGNDGKILTGLQKWAGNTYYFDPVKYTKVTNSDVTVNRVKYHLDKDGVATVKNDLGAKVNKALSQQGVPYVWGGNTPAGFDCSGLVQWAYGLDSAHRTTSQQATLGTHHYDVNNAPKGSLLFFGSDSAPYHVAISLGDGTYVHAPEPGDVVKIGYTKYFKPSFFITM